MTAQPSLTFSAPYSTTCEHHASVCAYFVEGWCPRQNTAATDLGVDPWGTKESDHCRAVVVDADWCGSAALLVVSQVPLLISSRPQP